MVKGFPFFIYYSITERTGKPKLRQLLFNGLTIVLLKFR